MTKELTYLAWAVVLGLAHAVATGQLAIFQHGMRYGLSSRDDPKPLTGIPGRINRAFANYMQTFPFFAAAVLLVQVTGRHDNWSAIGAQVYFWARVVYIPLYALNITVVRTVAFLASVGGIVALLIALTSAHA